MIAVRPADGTILRQKVLDIMDADSSIPTFSASTTKLNQMFNDADVSFSKLGRVIETDPTLAASCIKLASSAIYGRGRIDSVAHALSRIGIKEIRRLSTMRGVLDTLRRFRVEINWNIFMSHALLTARLTEHLCRGYVRKPVADGGSAYLAGLMHDIGRIFLKHHFPGEFEEMILRSMQTKEDVFEMERETVGITHAEVGALMCKKWNLNTDVIHAIRYHHEPMVISVMMNNVEESTNIMAMCLCAANAMANCYGEKFAGARILHENHEMMPEWNVLSRLTAVREIQFDIAGEIATVSELIATLLAA